MSENFVQPLGMSFQANQEMQGRGSEREIHHEAILHGDAKSSHAMQNSKGSSFKENLEHFLESILYTLYIILKLGKSGVQRFKQCTIWSWNEEVMANWRQLHKAEEEFCIDFLRCEIFRTTFLQCENVIVRYFTPTLLDFYLKIFGVNYQFSPCNSWRYFKIFRISN